MINGEEVLRELAERIKLLFYQEFDEIIPSIMADKIDSEVAEMLAHPTEKGGGQE